MGKTHRKKRRLTQRQRQKRIRKYRKIGILVLATIFAVLVCAKYISPLLAHDEYTENNSETIDALRPDIDVQLLTVNPYSRPGTETNKITGIVVHYTANPGSTAMDNRNYFEGLKDSHETKASSNFVIGLDGEIVQCVPTWEVAYASNSRNIDTVSIECCHPDESGAFQEMTYQSLVELVAFLCGKFNLTMDNVIRHYDVTGKDCPKYFVEHEDAWNAFKEDVAKYIEENGN